MAEFQFVLENDLAMQYRKPPADREITTAETQTEVQRVFDARSYFDGKLFTQEVKNDHSNLMKLLESSPHGKILCQEWIQLYGEPIKPIYYKNLIEEARSTINKIIKTSELDIHNFDLACTYSQYWEFIEENENIRMLATSVGTGVYPSFKKYILEGKIIEEIKENQGRLKALETDPRLHQIVMAYLDFCVFENTLYDASYYLKSHIERYLQTEQDMHKAELEKKESWTILEHKNRLSSTKRSIESTCNNIESHLKKIMGSQFFKMLKLREKIQHFQSTKGQILSEEDQEKQALDGLLDETFDLAKLTRVLQAEHIPVGTLFKLFYKFK